ncbi:MAG: hypothetical protein K2K63_07755, partial [Acetatifactor sp.]|nr:hypothetical protein [Acetatifactor sp.]
MRKKIQTFSELQKHLFSILLCTFYMTAAAGISSACSHVFSHLSLNCTLVFVLFIMLASCRAADWLYGILCSIFAVLWLDTRLHSLSADSLADILFALA